MTAKQEPREPATSESGSALASGPVQLVKGSQGVKLRRQLQNTTLIVLENTALGHQEPNVKLEPTDDKASRTKPAPVRVQIGSRLEANSVQVLTSKSVSKRTNALNMKPLEQLEAEAEMKLEEEVEEKRTKLDSVSDDEDWDDLDREDDGDPLMVSEYVVEIFENMRRQEVMHGELLLSLLT